MIQCICTAVSYQVATTLHLQDTYSFLVSEDVAVAATVGIVLADDSDLGSNGNILFQLLEGDGALFQLNTVPIRGPSGTQRFAGSLVNRRVCFC